MFSYKMKSSKRFTAKKGGIVLTDVFSIAGIQSKCYEPTFFVSLLFKVFP